MQPRTSHDIEENSFEKQHAANTALDTLFQNVYAFRNGKEAKELYNFVARFPRLAPFNAWLIYSQRKGCSMVATASDWRKKYGRSIKFTAAPLIILWPFGPVNFVFDISDTEEIPGAEGRPKPKLVEDPFGCQGEVSREIFKNLMTNLRGQGIIIATPKLGSQAGGSIQPLPKKYFQYVRTDQKLLKIRVLYGLKIAADAKPTETFATVAHELGHLFCGHLSAWVNDKTMPYRRDLAGKSREEILDLVEFEAESVAWLVCGRLSITPPSDSYLACYLENSEKAPDANIALIMKAVSRIEALYREGHSPRKDLILDRDARGAEKFMEWKE